MIARGAGAATVQTQTVDVYAVDEIVALALVQLSRSMDGFRKPQAALELVEARTVYLRKSYGSDPPRQRTSTQSPLAETEPVVPLPLKTNRKQPS